MALSWNEIKYRAIAFSKEWKTETRESAERQTFWNEFFNVFDVKRRIVATFEEPVKKLSGTWGSIDLLWPGVLLVEHKSAGEDLGKAHSQGMTYIRGLHDAGRASEIPRYLIVSDFRRIAIHDLEPEDDPGHTLFKHIPPSFEFHLADFHQHIRHFFFIAGYKQHRLNPEDPANEEATQLITEPTSPAEPPTSSNNSLSASCSASSPRITASFPPAPSSSTSRITPRPMAPTQGLSWASSSRCSTPLRPAASATLNPTCSPSPTSTATSSPSACRSPPSPARCGANCAPAARSIGRVSRPPFSGAFSKPSWSRANAAKSVLTIPPSATS